MTSNMIAVKSINEHARALASQGRITWIDVHNLAVALRDNGKHAPSLLGFFRTPQTDRYPAAEAVIKNVRGDEAQRAFFSFLGVKVASSVERPPLFTDAVTQSQTDATTHPLDDSGQANGGSKHIYVDQSVIENIKNNGYRLHAFEGLSAAAKEAIESGEVVEMEFFGRKRFGYFNKNGPKNDGGFVELSAKVDNSYIGKDAAVLDYAMVTAKSTVRGNARVSGSAIIESSDISENADVTGHAIVVKSEVSDNARVLKHAAIEASKILGKAEVTDRAKVNYSEVSDNAKVSEHAILENGAKVSGNAKIFGNPVVCDGSKVYGDAEISGESLVSGAEVFGDAEVYDNARVLPKCKVYGHAAVYGSACVSVDYHTNLPCEIYGDAYIRGEAQVISSIIHGDTTLSGDVQVIYSRISKNTNLSTGTINSEEIS
ncbi:hypothetical protein HY570_02420 [Candidatus Micrarchaeota archaeon]|nr:hypothetical protein [Candidatus Micrarchaeota archaeon]